MDTGGSGLDKVVKKYVYLDDPNNEIFNSNFVTRMGFLYGLQAAIAAHDIMMEEAKLQIDTLEALGISQLKVTKLKR